MVCLLFPLTSFTLPVLLPLFLPPPPSSSLLLVPPLPPLPPLSSLHYTHTFIRRIPKGETDRLQQFFSVCNSPYFFVLNTDWWSGPQSPTLSLSLTQTGAPTRLEGKRDDNVLCGSEVCVCVCVCVCVHACARAHVRVRVCVCVDVAHVVTRTLPVVQLTSEVVTCL